MHIILGAPGTGKTERLLTAVESAMDSGVSSHRVALVSFTRAAVGEARERARLRFGLNQTDLPWFRTLHSLCFKALACQRADLMNVADLQELAELTGESGLAHSADALEYPAYGSGSGSQLLALVDYARGTRQSIREAWQDHGGDLDWWRVERFALAYEHFRYDRGLMDFTDLLERFALYGEGVAPDVDLAVVDESQDLTPLQWAVVERAFKHCPNVIIAGDPPQAVHRWAGADPNWLQRIDRDATVEVLTVSHRLPIELLSHANELAIRIGEQHRQDLTSSRSGGSVQWIADPAEADLLLPGSWLLMARAAYQLDVLEESVRLAGVYYARNGESSVSAETLQAVRGYEALRAGRPVDAGTAKAVLHATGRRVKELPGELYGPGDLSVAPYCLDFDQIWHDALTNLDIETREYILVGLRRGEKFTGKPRVSLSTIHGAKGREADRAILMTDLPNRAARGMELDPEAEARVFYVGVTRASKELYLMAPRTSQYYPL